MIEMAYEKGVDPSWGNEVKKVAVMTECPICHDQRKIFVEFRKGKERSPIVKKVCHAEYLTAVNQRIKGGVILQMSDQK